MIYFLCFLSSFTGTLSGLSLMRWLNERRARRNLKMLLELERDVGDMVLRHSQSDRQVVEA
jgi:hypothetical protein